MKDLKPKKNLSSLPRRKFLGQVGLGGLAAVSLSSCELSDLNFIGKLKSNNNGVPSDADLKTFIALSKLQENIERIIDRTKKNVSSMREPSPAIGNLLSNDKVQKLLDEETQYYMNFYRAHYNAGEIKDLIAIHSSKVWLKYNESIQDINSTKPGSENERPSAKFFAQLNALLNTGRTKPVPPKI